MAFDGSAFAWAIIFGIGCLVFVISFSIKHEEGKDSNVFKRLEEDESGGPRLVSAFSLDSEEGNILLTMLADWSKMLRPVKGNLEEKIVKSGYIFKSPMEYYYRRIYYSVIGCAGFLMFGYAFGLDGLLMVIAGTVGVVYGFFYPDTRMNNAIKKRSKQIEREMAFGLDQIVLYLRASETLPAALTAMGNFGIFGQTIASIGSAVSTNTSFEEAINTARSKVPDNPNLEDFFVMVKSAGSGKGENLIDPFLQNAKMMRRALNDDVTKKGGQVKIEITLISASLLIAAGLIAIGAPVVYTMIFGL